MQHSVCLSMFQEFVSAVLRKVLFRKIGNEAFQFQSRTGYKETEDIDASGRITAVKEKTQQHGHIIVVLHGEFTRFATDVWRLAGKAQQGSRQFSRRFRSEQANCEEIVQSDFATAFDGIQRTAKRGFHSEKPNRCDARCSRLADHFGLSGKPRSFRCFSISDAM